MNETGPDAVPPPDSCSLEERRTDRLVPVPLPNLKSMPSVLARSRIDSMESWTELMKHAEACWEPLSGRRDSWPSELERLLKSSPEWVFLNRFAGTSDGSLELFVWGCKRPQSMPATYAPGPRCNAVDYTTGFWACQALNTRYLG